MDVERLTDLKKFVFLVKNACLEMLKLEITRKIYNYDTLI